MQQPSRRTLLAGTGTVLTLGAAGWIAQAEPSGEPTTDESASLPPGLESTFEYVYTPSDESGAFRVARVPENPRETPGGYHPWILEFGEPEWIVVDGALSGERGFVATGSFEVDTEEERVHADGSREGFDLYRVGEEGKTDDEGDRIATDGETLLLGEPEWVTATLDRSMSDEPTYLEATDGARTLLSVVDFSGQTTLVDDEAEIRKPFEQADVEPSHLPDRLLAHFTHSEDSVSYTLAGWYADLPAEGATEALTSFLSTQVGVDDVSTEVREANNVVIARGSRPYTPPSERPETAGHPRFHGYDAETGEVLFRFERGEELSVEHYEIEIEDEVYVGDWARGQDEIGEGSIIGIDAEAIEPGDHISVTYESPDGSYSSASGTSALRRLPFEVDFAPDERSAEVRYVGGPPLDADRISVVVDHGDEGTTREPWNGQLASGGTVRLSELPIEGHLSVEYERPDGERVRIGGGRFGPGGRFDFEYDGRAETLTIIYPESRRKGDRPGHPATQHRLEQDTLDADRYEITVDGKPADRQWADFDSDIEPGDSLTLRDVPVDTEIAVVWVGEDATSHDVAGTHTLPDVEFEYDYDESSEELTVTHGSGPAIEGAKLSVHVHMDGERTVGWGSDEEVTEGSSVVVEDVPEDGLVVVTYAESHLDHVHTRRLTKA